MSDRLQAHQLDLRRGFDAGVARYGDLQLTFDAYGTATLAAVSARLQKLGFDETPERVSAALQRLAGADLYLARACEAGSVDAWRILSADITPRLQGLARKRGARGAEPDELVSALLADLALPPPRGDTNTLIGTFGGAGSLFGWLAVVLVRRMAGAARKRPVHSLDTRPADEQDTAESPRRSAPAMDPSTAASDREGERRVARAIRTAWIGCTPKERLALLFKFRDGLSQRRMAAVLGVGEPRVSRLVKQGIAKLAAAVQEHVPEGLRPRDPVEAAGKISETLATLGVDTPPPPEAAPSGSDGGGSTEEPDAGGDPAAGGSER